MNTSTSLRRQTALVRLQLPVLMLLTLLQRTPVVRLLQSAGQVASASPVGNLLRSTVAAAASLGALHSLAGATTLVASVPAPATARVGTAITPIGFTVTDTINIGSWRVGGSLPPGLFFEAVQGGAVLSGPGVLDATTGGVDDGYGSVTGGNITTTPLLKGTPTAAGSYTISLQAFERGGIGGLASKSFDYTLTVAAAPATNSPPAFATQPAPQSVNVGATVTLSASASGTPIPTYQWQKNGTALAGATSATLTLSNVTVADAGAYTVVATNVAGAATSTTVTVAVTVPPPANAAPAIARHPAAQVAATGSTVVFNVDASGTP
ncbi:MAG: immunoglobulin domain-containing protein, partial [Verrucomicrobia bacterium]|nr:immunoglobulin domain-containing protein [Verrucomicrobiota bacterium]